MTDRLIRMLLLALPLLAVGPTHAEPETVYFASADGKTEIVGYLFKPTAPGPHPAVVLLHGRSGPYSANLNKDCTVVSRAVASACTAAALSRRHVMWGEFWAARGVLALLPDSFGPRGQAHGFGRFTHGDPDRDAVNERTVRPLDAEGALTYLRGRADVASNPIFLQGWSNGGSTTLNVMIRQGASGGFRAALAFYPGCGREALLDNTIRSQLPLLMFLGDSDEEVSPAICQHVAQRSTEAGTNVTVMLYSGATHDFDDPGEKRQEMPGNQAAKTKQMRMARAAAAVDGYRR